MKRLICILPVCLLWITGLQAQTAAVDNHISESITFRDMPKGPRVYGIFEGRSPCTQITSVLHVTMPAGCDHLKWQLTLFKDSVTQEPTTFILRTEMFNANPQNGKWRIVHGTKDNPSAVLFALDWNEPGRTLYLLKGDENVLFILDEHLEFMTGDQYFSYTLSRVKKVKH